MIEVRIDLKDTSQAIVKTAVVNAYTKGGFYCLYHSGKVEKFPLQDIFRVVEEYGESAGRKI